MQKTTLLVLSLFCAFLGTQARVEAQSFTAPQGFDNGAGGSLFYHWGGTAGRVMQIIDATQPSARPIQHVAFRRRGASVSGAGAGTCDVTLTMAECNFAFIDSIFANNHQINVAQVANGQINLPDWTMATSIPGPFDLVIKFSRPWVFTTRGAVVVTFSYKNSSSSSSRTMDRAGGSIPGATGASLGSGCGSFDDYARFFNSGNHTPGYGIHLQLGATNAPSNAPVFLFLDFVDSNLPVPGLCATLHAAPTLSLYFGLSDASGEVPDKYLNLPYAAAFNGATLYTQCVSVDTNQPVIPLVLTGGRRTTIPSNTTTNGFASCYQWTSPATATVGSGYITNGGCPVMQLK